MRVVAALCIALTLLSAGVPGSAAQDRDELVRVLARSSDFRVRAQAAFALGATGDQSMVDALVRALHDPHAVVRAAAATSLGRLGSTRANSALHRAERDRSAAVRMQAGRALAMISERGRATMPAAAALPATPRIRWDRVRYVVRLGDMGNQSGYETEAFAGLLRTEVTRHFAQQRAVALVLDEQSLGDEDARELRRRHLPRVRVDGNLVRVERQAERADLSVRCQVSLMLSDEPDRVVRGMLSGAATGREARAGDRARQERRLAEQALAGAVRSAMSNTSGALASAARR